MDKLEYVHFARPEGDINPSIHRCDVCGYESKSVFFLLNHVKRHQFPSQLFHCENSNLEVYSCRNCNIDFDIIIDLKKHIKKVHFLEEEPELGNLTCKICSFKTASCMNWYKHVMDECSPGTIQRKLATRENEETEKSLKSLKQNEFQQRNDINQEQPGFQCDKCMFEITSDSLASHSCEKRFQCDCGFRTKWRKYLLQHKRLKHTEDDEKEQHLRSNRKYLLKRRIGAKRTVYKEKRLFQCDKCTFESKWKSSLKAHIVAKHTNDKDKQSFQCDKCKHKSYRKGDLKKHVVAMHTDDKDKQWFRCDKCTFKTIHKYYLKRHICPKHTDGWFVCSFDNCAYTTSEGNNFVQHVYEKHVTR